MQGKVDKSKKHFEINNIKCWGKKQDYISTYTGNEMTDFYKNLGTIKVKKD